MNDDAADPFDLARFLEAQQETYGQALTEIRRGRKRTHWIWFVFPQIAGLGASPTAQFYAIRSLDEGRAYLDHPLLGARYVECVQTLQHLTDTTAESVFGGIDAMKLRSSLTLFSSVDDHPLFAAAIARWFKRPDEATVRILGVTD